MGVTRWRTGPPFDTMTTQTTYNFPADFRTEVFINQDNSITILQITNDINDQEVIITIGSKKRAIEIARAIRHLAVLADFKQEDMEP